ncbi:MAG: 30S ribosomal protein S9 [Rickettsiaceae bacterium]|jgi:small subunit ribosomal protein S9|nr:30S ribosomal protein S9 [Rickettsiaceae bacterium]
MEVPTLKELKEKAQEVKAPATAAHASEAPKIVQCKSKKSTPNGGGYGTGKRKNSIARVWVKPGKGKITVNSKDFSEYFPRESYRTAIMKPFVDTKTTAQYDVVCTTKGGGTTGQAGAIVHGIARALDCISDDFHAILRKNGFLTRDSRVVERKKYGKRKARKSTQFSKR